LIFQRTLLLVLFVTVFRTVTGATLEISDRELFQFAQFLYKNGEYYRAISEYERLQFFFPQSEFKNESIIQVGRSYMAGGRLQEAINYWDSLEDDQSTFMENNQQVRILSGITWLDLDRVKTFRFRQSNIQQGLKDFSKIKGDSKNITLIRNFMRDWKERPEPEYKAPILAGTMSAILPGTGSFYTGRYIEGTYALFITSLFYLAAVDSFRNQNEIPGYVFSFFALTFHGGSIYTAMNGAHKLNNKMDSDALFNLRKKHGIWYTPETVHSKGRF